MNFFSVLESDDDEEKPQVASSQGKKDAAKGQQKAKGAATATAAHADTVLPPSQVSGGRGGGGRGGRGHGAGRGSSHRGEGKNKVKTEEGEQPRKREFDRRSGTGRGKEVSKGGSGKSNWGNVKDEAHEAEKEHAPAEGTEEATGENAVENEQTNVQEAPPAEPEKPTFTLDEYMSKRNASRSNNEAFGAVSERSPKTDFSGMKPKEEAEATFIALGSSKSKTAGKKEQRSENKSVVTDLGFKVAEKVDTRDSNGGRGGDRGGRGGNGRGAGGRGSGRSPSGGRGASNNSSRGSGGRGGSKIDINDANAFPSL